MRLAEVLEQGIRKLKQADGDSPQLDARVLAGHALGLDRAEMLSQSQRVLMPEEIALVEGLLARRAAGEPVGRILGKREFWGLEFGLNEATLEPRPDSETLVESVLKIGRDRLRVLDLGTGTGCLLLALLHEMPCATGVGIDISPRAVEQAALNAAALGPEGRVEFRVGDWLKGVTGTFDIIVSNPPYIPSSCIPALMKEVREHDPLLALDGGADGLAPYRAVVPLMGDYLNPQGIVAFEVGQGQAEQVADLLRQSGFLDVVIHTDLGGIQRCVTALRA